jgi:CRP/FNR family cyclic AMP-dependent transcriptional regulator
MPFLAKIGSRRASRGYTRNEGVFAQGDVADAVFYIESGKVNLTVVSARGKTAVVGILGRGSFFGEGCLAGQPIRMSAARTTLPCRIFRVGKAAMIRLLHNEPEFAARFTAYLLSRNARIEGDLVTQLFNSSEKRLARLLLRLARFGKASKPRTAIPKLSRATLASAIGATPRKVGYFMNRFRQMGFIDERGSRLEVHSALLAVVLRDSA